jgi:hypothetical protein
MNIFVLFPDQLYYDDYAIDILKKNGTIYILEEPFLFNTNNLINSKQNDKINFCKHV